MAVKMVSVMGRVNRITTDRTRWKNYSPEVFFQDLYLQFKVPSDEAVVKEDGSIIITLGGFTAILDSFADAIDEMHHAWEVRQGEKAQEEFLESQRKPRKSKS